MTQRDTLFLLPPGFFDNERREYCPECAELWGLMSWHPALLQSVDIHYQPIDKPRADMVARLGERHQNCPTLILAQDSPGADHAEILTHKGERFINNARDIGRYYAERFGTPIPRGT